MSLSPTLLDRSVEEEEGIRSHFLQKAVERSSMDIFCETASYVWGNLLLLIAGRSLISSYPLLYSKRGAVIGAGYTDVVINLWVYRFNAVLALVAELFCLFEKTQQEIRDVHNCNDFSNHLGSSFWKRQFKTLLLHRMSYQRKALYRKCNQIYKFGIWIA